MTRARSIETGDATAGARVEYVKTRRVVRLGGWHETGREIRPLEVPASRFLDDLGIAPEELGAVPAFLVFAVVQERPSGMMRQLVAAFPSELPARQLFLRLRSEHQLPGEWAQVMVLDARCRLEPICWFGAPALLNVGVAPLPEAAETPARPRRWASRRPRG